MFKKWWIRFGWIEIEFRWILVVVSQFLDKIWESYVGLKIGILEKEEGGNIPDIFPAQGYFCELQFVEGYFVRFKGLDFWGASLQM